MQAALDDVMIENLSRYMMHLLSMNISVEGQNHFTVELFVGPLLRMFPFSVQEMLL
jgi:hypothetical protein